MQNESFCWAKWFSPVPKIACLWLVPVIWRTEGTTVSPSSWSNDWVTSDSPIFRELTSHIGRFLTKIRIDHPQPKDFFWNSKSFVRSRNSPMSFHLICDWPANIDQRRNHKARRLGFLTAPPKPWRTVSTEDLCTSEGDRGRWSVCWNCTPDKSGYLQLVKIPFRTDKISSLRCDCVLPSLTNLLQANFPAKLFW